MISKFLREQRRYTQKEICAVFECAEEEAIPLIGRLREFGVLKEAKAGEAQQDLSELLDADAGAADAEVPGDERVYAFTFVGVIVASGRVLKCYPKYLLKTEEPKEELLQVLKVLRKYSAKEQALAAFNDSDESQAFNLLALLLYLTQDYYENGIYKNTEKVVERNGPGEISWDRTINDTLALFLGDRPCYPELLTQRRVADEYDYFSRLHRCVLTRASAELRDADLLELFEIPEIDLSDEELEDFGDKEYILYRLEGELNTKFSTRKQLLLKALYAYVNRRSSLFDDDNFSFFGTSSFNLVWEKVCADILGDQLHVSLGALDLPVPLRSGYGQGTRLIDLIEKPLWTITGESAKDTLIPDLVTITRTGAEHQFLIFDAKYYAARLEKGSPPKAQPGIESVAKQYLYQLAYQEFLNDHEIRSVKNCFLMPTEEDVILNKGQVSLRMLKKLGLQDIEVRLLPAKEAYACYLAGASMDVALLKL